MQVSLNIFNFEVPDEYIVIEEPNCITLVSPDGWMDFSDNRTEKYNKGMIVMRVCMRAGGISELRTTILDTDGRPFLRAKEVMEEFAILFRNWSRNWALIPWGDNKYRENKS